MKGADVLIRPYRAGIEIRRHPRWVGPFILLCVIDVAILVIVYPDAMDVMMRNLPGSATTADRELVSSTMKDELALRSMFLPFRIGFGCYLFALFLYRTCKAFMPPEPVRFVHVFSAVVFSEFILLGNKLVIVGRALLGTPVNGTESFLNPLNVGNLMDNTIDFTMVGAVNQVNFFAVWNLLALSALISGISGFKFTKAFFITFMVIAVVIALNTGIVRLLFDGLSFRL